MGKHSAPMSSGATLQPAQFGKHRSVFSSDNPSLRTRVKEDMHRRQSAQISSHAKPGKHAKAYDADEDIKTSMSSKKKNYKAKHDVLGLNKSAPGKGTINNPSKKKPGRKKNNVHSAITKFRPSKHEGKNAARLREMVK